MAPTMKKKMILIPQKCCGYITPKTPEIFAGLFLVGLGPCAGVVVMIRAQDYFFLCHADASTDMASQSGGIPFWIRMIPKDRGVITIQCDDTDDNRYVNQVNAIVIDLKKEGHDIQVESISSKATDIAIIRKTGEIIREGGLLLALDGEEYGNQYEIEKPEVNDYIRNIIEDPRITSYLPILVFDGIHVLANAELLERYPALKPALSIPLPPHPGADRDEGSGASASRCGHP